MSSKKSWIWRCFQVGTLILPFISSIGTVLLGIVLITTLIKQYRLIYTSIFTKVLLFLSIWLVITSLTAFNQIDALLGLGNFIPFFLLFICFSQLFRRIGQLEEFASWIVTPSSIITILGLGQLKLNWSIPEILGSGLIAEGVPGGRMSSVFIHANMLALYLLVAFSLGLGLWWNSWQRYRNGKGKLWRVLFLSGTILLDGLGIILTSSRNSWGLGFIIALIFAYRIGWKWLLWGACGLGGSLLWAAFGVSPSRDWLREIIPSYFWARITDQMYPDRPLATLRQTQWHFAWDMTIQRPWLGWGMRNFSILYQEKMGEWLGHPHNIFLMFMAEIGIPATLVLMLIVGILMAKAVVLLYLWHRRKHNQEHQMILFTFVVAFLGCSFFNMFDVSIYDLRMNIIGWILLSAIAGIIKRYPTAVHAKGN